MWPSAASPITLASFPVDTTSASTSDSTPPARQDGSPTLSTATQASSMVPAAAAGVASGARRGPMMIEAAGPSAAVPHRPVPIPVLVQPASTGAAAEPAVSHSLAVSGIPVGHWGHHPHHHLVVPPSAGTSNPVEEGSPAGAVLPLHMAQAAPGHLAGVPPMGYLVDPYYSNGMVPAGQPKGPQGLPPNAQAPRVPIPQENTAVDEDPVYVNAKQYTAILRRRQQRAKAEQENKMLTTRRPYLHKSRHNHAVRRPRGPGGRFLTADELQEWRKKHPEPALDSAED